MGGGRENKVSQVIMEKGKDGWGWGGGAQNKLSRLITT